MKNFAVTLHISFKNNSFKSFEKFINKISKAYHFIILSSSSNDHKHAILGKSISAEAINPAFESVKKELVKIKINELSKIRFQLSITGSKGEVLTESIHFS